MTISQMSDSELRLAIAEIIAKEKGYTIVAMQDVDDLHFAIPSIEESAKGLQGAEKYPVQKQADTTSYDPIPNYLSDIEAALGLLDEYVYYDLKISYSSESVENKYMAILWVKLTPYSSAWCKTSSRAISEAWLTERIGGNDD